MFHLFLIVFTTSLFQCLKFIGLFRYYINWLLNFCIANITASHGEGWIEAERCVAHRRSGSPHVSRFSLPDARVPEPVGAGLEDVAFGPVQPIWG